MKKKLTQDCEQPTMVKHLAEFLCSGNHLGRGDFHQRLKLLAPILIILYALFISQDFLLLQCAELFLTSSSFQFCSFCFLQLFNFVQQVSSPHHNII